MKELMKEIGDYWSTRTEGYSEVNETGRICGSWILAQDLDFSL